MRRVRIPGAFGLGGVLLFVAWRLAFAQAEEPLEIQGKVVLVRVKENELLVSYKKNPVDRVETFTLFPLVPETELKNIEALGDLHINDAVSLRFVEPSAGNYRVLSVERLEEEVLGETEAKESAATESAG